MKAAQPYKHIDMERTLQIAPSIRYWLNVAIDTYSSAVELLAPEVVLVLLAQPLAAKLFVDASLADF